MSVGLLLAAADFHVSSNQRPPLSIQLHLAVSKVFPNIGLLTKTSLESFESFLVFLIIFQQTLIAKFIDHVDAWKNLFVFLFDIELFGVFEQSEEGLVVMQGEQNSKVVKAQALLEESEGLG